MATLGTWPTVSLEGLHTEPEIQPPLVLVKPTVRDPKVTVLT